MVSLAGTGPREFQPVRFMAGERLVRHPEMSLYEILGVDDKADEAALKVDISVTSLFNPHFI